jgi:outer membrane protein TolC
MRKTWIIALLFFIGQKAQAQANAELNTLIQGSFNYFPRINELNKAEELSEMRIELARTGYLPTVTGVASYTYLNPISQKEFVVGPNEAQLLKFQPYNNYNMNVGVTQLIWDFGKTKAQVEKAKADLLTSRQNIEAGKLQLATQVAGIYYSMIYLKRAAQVQDSVISVYAENLRMVEGKIKQGDALQIDLSTIKSNIDQEKNRKVEFLRLYGRQSALMRYSTGQSLEPGIAQFDFKSPVVGELANNPEVLAANERISSARADLKFAQSNRLPSLNFQGGAGLRNGYQPDINLNRFNYVAGITLGVPIFQGGRLNKNTVLASKSMELNELSRATLTSTFQKDLESTQLDLKAYDEQIKNSVGQIDVANETLRLTEVRYKQGVATYLDLINASTNLQRANLNRLQYEYQRTQSQIELCRILGVKFWQE